MERQIQQPSLPSPAAAQAPSRRPPQQLGHVVATRPPSPPAGLSPEGPDLAGATTPAVKARRCPRRSSLRERESLATAVPAAARLAGQPLELKGNIRVFCRVRPLLPNESGAVAYPKSGENLGRGIELTHNGQMYFFTFDKVFEQSTSQEDVFIEISHLVQSALDGYKVCIFAYGQTGSGKTYTMMGNPELHDQKGLIPRSLEQIFQTSQALISQGWKYKMQASMLEIYNEAICDLLATNHTTIQDGGASKYSIKHDANGNTHVSDLIIVDVLSINEVSSLLKRAAQSRSVGRTQMNEESSRSHCVFTLRFFGVNEGTDQQVQGVLNLIDLAGSERLNKSGATGDRLKETQAINKSLSCLSDVIFSIAKKEEHVPFRNSKLTYLLQGCNGSFASPPCVGHGHICLEVLTEYEVILHSVDVNIYVNVMTSETNTSTPPLKLGHLCHDLLEDDLGVGVGGADLGVVLGAAGLLEALEAVKEAGDESRASP
nr:Kinesin-1, putative [Oryza sativa Japonica Group]